jgi:hypothetical protein
MAKQKEIKTWDQVLDDFYLLDLDSKIKVHNGVKNKLDAEKAAAEEQLQKLKDVDK